jgi:hypothetical protein
LRTPWYRLLSDRYQEDTAADVTQAGPGEAGARQGEPVAEGMAAVAEAGLRSPR